MHTLQFKNHDAAAFTEHWGRIRGDSLIPVYERFLDKPSVLHAPDLFIFELDGDLLRVRLQGTRLVERWGKDYTGLVLYANKPPEFRQKSLSNFRAVASHPCGCYFVDEFISTRGRLSQACSVLLPLQRKTGQLPAVAGYSRELAARHTDELLVTKCRTLEASWLDLGAGVPATLPEMPAD